jgi:plastocyanin
MSRSTAPRMAMATLVLAAVAPLALPIGANAAPEEERVRVSDLVVQPDGSRTGGFSPVPVEVEAGGTVVWVLDPGAGRHTVSSNEDGRFHAVLGGGDGPTTYSRPFNTPGTYTYHCLVHADQGMSGQVEVTEPPPPPPPTTTTTTEPPPTTTTTTEPPPTTTTTMAPAPTTTTTQPPGTTSTTRRPPGTTTTQPPASASGGTPGTTSTTARSTTTTGKPTPGKATTSSTAKKKPASTTTTMAPETTTTLALPADWIPTPDMVPDGSPTTTTTGPETEAAAGSRPKGGRGGGGGGLPTAGILGLAVLLLGGGGWAWYHRSSRYLPA